MKKIDENKWYSTTQIEREKLLPFLPSRWLIVKWIKAGKLKAVEIGDDNNRGKRYSIKGSWLISFIAKWESGDFRG